MTRQRHKKLIISKSEVTAINKTISFDITRPIPTRIIRWSDRDGNHHEIYLFSDNYPGIPSQRKKNMSATTERWINVHIETDSYWFNRYPNLIPLLESVSGVLNLIANISKNGYKNIRKQVVSNSIFYDWLSSVNTKFSPSSISDISLDLLLRFRDHLYYEYDKSRLLKGGNNQHVWQTSIPYILRFFLNRPGYDLVHPSLNLSNFPKFSNPSNNCSSVKPYSDIESFAIISSADSYCKNYMHNWFVMRSIESIKIGSWNNLNDICWELYYIECDSTQNIRASLHGIAFIYLKRYFNMTWNDFYSKYSFDEIQQMAEKGCCPYHYYKIDMLDGLSDKARLKLAHSCIRYKLKDFFDARTLLLASSLEPNWEQFVKRLARKANNINSTLENRFQVWWETAGFKKVITDSKWWLLTLFIPTTNSIYPFHLFVLSTSGANLEVVNSIDRFDVYPDLNPSNLIYPSVKKRTGDYDYRFEEIVVPRDEEDGIHQRIEFIKDITYSLYRFRETTAIRKHLWVSLHISSPKIVSFSGKKGYPFFNNASRHFARSVNLQQINHIDSNGCPNITPIHKVDTRRMRKTNVFNDMNNQVPYHLIQAALADGSFETVFRWYIDTSVQRRENFKIIAALQDILIEDFMKYSRESSFVGEIVYDIEISDAKDINNNFLNACTDPDHARVIGIATGCKCSIQQFDICLGCLNSRVFREHLASICFRIIQYDNKKKIMPNHDWTASYGIYHSRAVDCLSKYANHGDIYRSHVDDAWLLAKTDGGVYLPPLF